MSETETGFEVGRQFSFSKTFTTDDVKAFAAVSEDYGRHHTVPDEHGRLMVHGLHTATLATQIGGSIHYISRDMHFEFLAPAYSGDTITCVATVDEAEQQRGRWKYLISFEFANQDGEVVATGSSRGIILD